MSKKADKKLKSEILKSASGAFAVTATPKLKTKTPGAMSLKKLGNLARFSPDYAVRRWANALRDDLIARKFAGKTFKAGMVGASVTKAANEYMDEPASDDPIFRAIKEKRLTSPDPAVRLRAQLASRGQKLDELG